jgi:hypothetical protein
MMHVAMLQAYRLMRLDPERVTVLLFGLDSFILKTIVPYCHQMPSSTSKWHIHVIVMRSIHIVFNNPSNGSEVVY